jgi:hypothetical protein
MLLVAFDGELEATGDLSGWKVPRLLPATIAESGVAKRLATDMAMLTVAATPHLHRTTSGQPTRNCRRRNAQQKPNGR